MPTWKLILAYDGTPFHGWQVQPGLPTVQGTLAAALRRITGEEVLPQGSGRTDTGVHALGQVASFALRSPVPPRNLRRALNNILPGAIRVLSAEVVADGFHARHAALRKTYEYRLLAAQPGEDRDRRLCPPTLAPFVWDARWTLELAPMQEAAAAVVGEHDFLSFAATDPDLAARTEEEGSPRSAVRRIHSSAWHLEQGAFVYRVTGSGFLHHMVRNLVGTFVECGRGALPAGAMPEILAARRRAAAGPTAPARGLFLHSVEYPAAEVTTTGEQAEP